MMNLHQSDPLPPVSTPEPPNHVLLVDDDASVRESLRRVLQLEGYEVLTAANGREAMASFNLQRFDLVLLDLNMPLLNGWDTFERMTSFNPFQTIVLITARLDQEELAAVAGAAALLEKPLDVRLLVEVMDRLRREPFDRRLRRLVSGSTIVLPPALDDGAILDPLDARG